MGNRLMENSAPSTRNFQAIGGVIPLNAPTHLRYPLVAATSIGKEMPRIIGAGREVRRISAESLPKFKDGLRTLDRANFQSSWKCGQCL
jgi:hypothetical protein